MFQENYWKKRINHVILACIPCSGKHSTPKTSLNFFQNQIKLPFFQSYPTRLLSFPRKGDGTGYGFREKQMKYFLQIGPVVRFRLVGGIPNQSVAVLALSGHQSKLLLMI
ncbi:hypothetical protein CEXT_598921 [Caerostris extrusa]|uniref:Uncharacterized protein n=1 Tax=Caerostris extrusa TaxID=172846 RepID=A0AAV4N0Q6_CAEEX|nr:hypothetical protein CEXT_598921 [Caerostris extrusa]